MRGVFPQGLRLVNIPYKCHPPVDSLPREHRPLSLEIGCGGVAGGRGLIELVLSDIAENPASIAYPPQRYPIVGSIYEP